MSRTESISEGIFYACSGVRLEILMYTQNKDMDFALIGIPESKHCRLSYAAFYLYIITYVSHPIKSGNCFPTPM